MKKPLIWTIYSTFSTRAEALSVAHNLVEKRLISCANIHENAVSVYPWKGTVNEALEVIFTAKTSEKKLQAAMDEIKRLHSYEVPCIVAYPVAAGLPAYLQWVADETR